jgi:lipid II:glycine glycyltransferase (peptidoglycan interpeptide bridge formation enzyme)
VEITDKRWDDFIQNSNENNILQSSAMRRVYMNTRAHFPISLAVINEQTNEIEGVLLSVLRHQSRFGTFTARAHIIYGPIAKSTRAARYLVREHDDIMRSKAVFTLRKPYFLGSSSIVREAFVQEKYAEEAALNSFCRVDKQESQIFSEMNKKRRWGIRKSVRMGVKIEELEDKDQIDDFYQLHLTACLRTKYPTDEKSFFDSVFDFLVRQKMARILFAKHNGKYVAGLLVFLYKPVITHWATVYDENGLKTCSTERLVWEVLKWGAQNNYVYFDFVGGDPDSRSGSYIFKREFGANIVKSSIFKKIYHPKYLQFAQKALFPIYRHSLFRSILETISAR